MTKLITAGEAAKILQSNDSYLILTHAHPDGDTLGSGFGLCSALRKMGKKANVICSDEIPAKFGYLTVEGDETFEPQTVISVDVADPKLLGSLQAEYGGRVLLAIDHHSSNVKFAENLYLEGESASACECVYKVIKELGAEVTPFIASCLYTGIATDTGCFKFSNTTPRTHIFAAELIEKGADSAEINRVMFEVKTKSRLEMERRVLDEIEYLADGKCAIVTVSQKMINETQCDSSDMDGISALSRQIEGVLIGVTVREKTDGNWKISVRTFEPYDAAAICRVFGGGGHVRAAGCEFSCSLEETKAQLKAEILKVLGET